MNVMSSLKKLKLKLKSEVKVRGERRILKGQFTNADLHFLDD